jgi:hypothetical protein
VTTKPQQRTAWRALPWLIPAVLLAGAAYEVALLLWGSYGGLDAGQPPAGERVVDMAGALAMIASFFLAGVVAIRPRLTRAIAMFAPAAAALLIARYFTYDPYYFPTLRSYSDGGILPLWWMLLIVCTSILVGIATRIRPRPGSWSTFLIMPLDLFTLVYMGAGH